MKVKHPNFLTPREQECHHFLNMQIQTSQSTLDWGRLERIVEELEERFPDKFPDHNLDPKQIAYRAGQISIIKLLKQQLNE